MRASLITDIDDNNNALNLLLQDFTQASPWMSQSPGKTKNKSSPFP